jgi:hypothetical protein
MQKRKFTRQDVHEVYRHWEDKMGDTERLTKKKVEGWLRYHPSALVIKTIGIASQQGFTLPYPQCLNTKKANKHYLTQAFKFIQNYLWTHRQSGAPDAVVSGKGTWRNVEGVWMVFTGFEPESYSAIEVKKQNGSKQNIRVKEPKPFHEGYLSLVDKRLD